MAAKVKPEAPAGKRRRSPNYPAVHLEDAVNRVTKLYHADGAAGAPEDAACIHIGYSQAHGQAKSVLSALKKFGLIEDKNGRCVPTKAAVDLINFPADHQRSIAAKRECALKPAIYKELIDKFGEVGRLPSDESLKPELISDRGFAPKAVDGFLADFRKSLEYAGILKDSTLDLSLDPSQKDSGNGSGSGKPIESGAYVQWTSNGVDQFEKPRIVRGISEDGGFAFVEGTQTGIPMSELSTVEQPTTPPIHKPPANPFFQKEVEVQTGAEQERWKLDEGFASITWPENLSKESVEDLEYKIDGVLRRLRRKAGLAEKKK